MNLSDWVGELQYVKRTAQEKDFALFNRDSACFLRYVELQADTANRQGFTEIAEEIRKVTV